MQRPSLVRTQIFQKDLNSEEEDAEEEQKGSYHPQSNKSNGSSSSEEKKSIKKKDDEYKSNMASSFSQSSLDMIPSISLKNKEGVAKYFLKLIKTEEYSSYPNQKFARTCKNMIERHGIIGVLHTRIEKKIVKQYPHKCTALLMAVCSLLVINESTEKQHALKKLKKEKIVPDDNPFKFLPRSKVRYSQMKADIHTISLSSLSSYLELIQYWVEDYNNFNDDDDENSEAISDLNELLYMPWSKKISNVLTRIANIMKIRIEVLDLESLDRASTESHYLQIIKGGDRGTAVLGFNHYKDSNRKFIKFNIFFNKAQYMAKVDKESDDEDEENKLSNFVIDLHIKKQIIKLFDTLNEENKFEVKYLQHSGYTFTEYFNDREEHKKEEQKLYEMSMTRINHIAPPQPILELPIHRWELIPPLMPIGRADAQASYRLPVIAEQNLNPRPSLYDVSIEVRPPHRGILDRMSPRAEQNSNIRNIHPIEPVLTIARPLRGARNRI